MSHYEVIDLATGRVYDPTTLKAYGYHIPDMIGYEPSYGKVIDRRKQYNRLVSRLKRKFNQALSRAKAGKDLGAGRSLKAVKRLSKRVVRFYQKLQGQGKTKGLSSPKSIFSSFNSKRRRAGFRKGKKVGKGNMKVDGLKKWNDLRKFAGMERVKS